VVVLIGSLIGTFVGAIAGYLGGLWDEIMMRLTELVMAFPTIILALAITAALGPSIRTAIIALVIVWWPSYARVVRSLVLEAKSQDYVEAMRDWTVHSVPHDFAELYLPGHYPGHALYLPGHYPGHAGHRHCYSHVCWVELPRIRSGTFFTRMGPHGVRRGQSVRSVVDVAVSWAGDRHSSAGLQLYR